MKDNFMMSLLFLMSVLTGIILLAGCSNPDPNREWNIWTGYGYYCNDNSSCQGSSSGCSCNGSNNKDDDDNQQDSTPTDPSDPRLAAEPTSLKLYIDPATYTPGESKQGDTIRIYFKFYNGTAECIPPQSFQYIGLTLSDGVTLSVSFTEDPYRQVYVDYTLGAPCETKFHGYAMSSTTNNFVDPLKTETITLDRGDFKNMIISTPSELQSISGKNGMFKLGANIDFDDYPLPWNPISEFWGILDGNGYVIKNFSMDVSKQSSIGLFETIEGTVQNLVLENVEINASGSADTLGIIAAQNNGKITSVTVSGSINAEHYTVIGGIAAINGENGIITDCTSNVSINGRAAVGGICAMSNSSANAISGCVNNGSLKANGKLDINNDKSTYIGGIVGSGFAVTNCINNGNITSQAGIKVGGIAGRCKGEISNSQNNGSIIGSDYTGGIVGAAEAPVISSLNKGDVKGGNCTAGIIGWTNAQTAFDSLINEGKVKGLDNTAGILGLTQNAIELKNCQNKADIEGGTWVGGYVANLGATASVIRDAVNNNSVTGSAVIGGIIGIGNETSIYGSENHGKITSTSYYNENGAQHSYVGGIAGLCLNLDDCKNTGEVTAYYARVAGIAAGVYGNVTLCVNSGKVTGKNFTAGISAQINQGLSETTNNGEVIGGNYTAGICAAYYGANADILENNATVTGGDYTGGIFGYVHNAFDFSNAENNASVKGGLYTGGYIGYSNGSLNIYSLTNKQTVEGGAHVGGIVGIGNYTNISHCNNYGKITSSVTVDGNHNYSYLGGIAGICSSVTNCTNTQSLISSGGRVGGIAGFLYGNATSCTNSGSVSGANYVGGIAGDLANVTDCINTKSVNGKLRVGGIAGNIRGEKAERCNNSGNITASENYCGGIIGYSEGHKSILACENSGSISNAEFSGAIVGYANANLQIIGAVNTSAKENLYGFVAGQYSN